MAANEKTYEALVQLRMFVQFASDQGFPGSTNIRINVIEDALDFICPECGASMGVGEYEAAGICSDCYFDIVEDSK